MMIVFQSSSALERKILMSGFLEAQVLQTKPFLPTEVQSFTVKYEISMM